jgi:hypothetical protein
MKTNTVMILVLVTSLAAGPLAAGKPTASYGRFAAEVTGAVQGAWTSKEYKLTNKDDQMNFNASGGNHYLYFSAAFINGFGALRGPECFSGDLGGTAQIYEGGSGKDADHLMTIWIHAPNADPNDNELIYYALDLFNTNWWPWSGLFLPKPGGGWSSNTATSWEMRTAGRGYLKHDPCIGQGDFFPGGEVVNISIKRLY